MHGKNGEVVVDRKAVCYLSVYTTSLDITPIIATKYYAHMDVISYNFEEKAWRRKSPRQNKRPCR